MDGAPCEPARILAVINELLFGGDENRLLAMARSMNRDRYAVHVVTLRSEAVETHSRFGSLRAQYTDAGVQVQNLGLDAKNQGLSVNDARRHLRRLQLLGKAIPALIKIVRSEKIHLVSAHTGPGFLSALLLHLICGVPYTITTYNVREEWHPLWLWRYVHKMTLARAAAVITDSQAVADAIRRDMVPEHRRIVVIPNGVALPKSVYSRAQMHERFGIPQDPALRVIGQVSTLVPTKGQNFLIEAAPRILELHPNSIFLFIGFTRSDAPDYPLQLQQRAEDLGVIDRVRFVAHEGPICDAWQAIDIQAHPTLLDSLPQAIIEGMSLGKPCVASAVAGIPTMIENGESGYVIEPGDIEALAGHLGELARNDSLAERMGQLARSRYEERYTVEQMVASLEAVYDAIAAEQIESTT